MATTLREAARLSRGGQSRVVQPSHCTEEAGSWAARVSRSVATACEGLQRPAGLLTHSGARRGARPSAVNAALTGLQVRTSLTINPHVPVHWEGESQVAEGGTS